MEEEEDGAGVRASCPPCLTKRDLYHLCERLSQQLGGGEVPPSPEREEGTVQEPSEQTVSGSRTRALAWIVSSSQGGFIRAYGFGFFIIIFFPPDLGLSFI